MTARKIHNSRAYGLRGKHHDNGRNIMWCSPPGWLFVDCTSIDFPNSMTGKLLKIFRINKNDPDGPGWNKEDWAWDSRFETRRNPPLMEGWINDEE